MNVLILNGGSSSLKYHLFDMNSDLTIFKGIISNIGLDDSECIEISGGNGNDGIVRGLQHRWLIDEESAGQTITTAQDLYGGADGSGTNSPTYVGDVLRFKRNR